MERLIPDSVTGFTDHAQSGGGAADPAGETKTAATTPRSGYGAECVVVIRLPSLEPVCEQQRAEIHTPRSTLAQVLELESYEIFRPVLVYVRPLAFLTFTGIVTIVLCRLAQEMKLKDLVGADLSAAAAITLAVAIFGYLQWIYVRKETSIDKFYERLHQTNRELSDWEAARALINPDWSGPEGKARFERDMYVFEEIDNLEYSIEKYRLGCMTPEHMLRAVRTFEARCRKPSRGFLEIALRLASDHGYKQMTARVVSNICKNIKAEYSASTQSGGG